VKEIHEYTQGGAKPQGIFKGDYRYKNKYPPSRHYYIFRKPDETHVLKPAYIERG
jgi:hypothetical protein